jgi:hypothetical protein
MNYKEIVDNTLKYHYFIASSSKIILLSSSNDKSEAKKIALKKLEPNIDKFIGKKLILLRVKSVESAFEKQKEDKTIMQLIGGPIVLRFEEGIIESPNKIKNKGVGENNLVYISKKYLKTHNNKINSSELIDVASKYTYNKLNQGLFNQNIL